jgi:hypothetical protein
MFNTITIKLFEKLQMKVFINACVFLLFPIDNTYEIFIRSIVMVTNILNERRKQCILLYRIFQKQEQEIGG